MIRAVIIDDEKNNIANLRGLLEKHCPVVSVIATASSASIGRAIITKHAPDLVFLDIQMPDGDGFELLQSIPDHSFELIFVTAFDQYGIQAVKFSAIDYLLKPVNVSELISAVEKAVQKTTERKKNMRLENLLDLLQHKQQKDEHRLALPTSKETRFVKPMQIIRCESSNVYTYFFLADGQKIIISKPIFEYEELLKDYGFIRCHQSHLVNKAYVTSWIREDGGYLLLEDGSRIPVSRTKKETITEALSSLKK